MSDLAPVGMPGARGRSPGSVSPERVGRRKTLRLRRPDALTSVQLAPASTLFLLCVAAPLGFFVIFSFWQLKNYEIVPQWTPGNYRSAVGDASFRSLLWNTLEIALATAVVTTTIATVLASVLRFRLARWQNAIMFLIMIALFSGYLVRIFAWETLLGQQGAINKLLETLGVIDHPISVLLYTRASAIIVLTNFLIPMAILPCYAAFHNVRESEVEAARDLGGSAVQAYRRVVLPLAWPGVFAAFALTFIIASGDYLTPQLVGGVSGTMVGEQIAGTFLTEFNWPLGAAYAVIDLGVVLLAVVAVKAVTNRAVR
jgi:spermidine/putrescine transport system permease protein